MTKEQQSAFSYRIMQANPTELVVILFEMAECYIGEAHEKYQALLQDPQAADVLEKRRERMDVYESSGIQERIEDFRHSIDLAEAVIGELNHSLDLKYSLSVNLMQIYMAILNSLRSAASSLDGSELIRDQKMLAKLRVSFSQIAKEDNHGPVMQNTQTVYAGLTYGRGTLNETFGSEVNRGFRV